MSARYINPYTDFGFKKLFGEEANKDLLIDFLNQLLTEKHQIAELEFKNVENYPELALERKAIFDIHCTSEKGERFIVEMQKAKVQYFKDRSLFYTTFPIKEQAERGDWDFKLEPIYFIAILDFFYDVEKEKAKVKRDVMLKDQDCEVFFEKLRFIFLQMPAFNKKEHELETHYDKWLYFLKHLQDFNDIPQILREPIFKKAFRIAEIANFNRNELAVYEQSLLAYRDLVNVMDAKVREGVDMGIDIGIDIGREEEKINTILHCHKNGFALEAIAIIARMTIAEVQSIIEKHTS